MEYKQSHCEDLTELHIHVLSGCFWNRPLSYLGKVEHRNRTDSVFSYDFNKAGVYIQSTCPRNGIKGNPSHHLDANKSIISEECISALTTKKLLFCSTSPSNTLVMLFTLFVQQLQRFRCNIHSCPASLRCKMFVPVNSEVNITARIQL